MRILLIATVVFAATGCGLYFDTTDKHVQTHSGSGSGPDAGVYPDDGGCGTEHDAGWPWYPDAQPWPDDASFSPDGGVYPSDGGPCCTHDAGTWPFPDAH